MLVETDKRLLWKLFWNMGVKGLWSVYRHQQRLRRGQFFPPYLYISIINSCNLRCQGCWVDVSAKQQKIDLPAMNRMISEAKAMGNSFFGLLGGEPFMHAELFDILAAHPDAYFQVFTNGQFIDETAARRLRQLGNVTVLISIEGSEIVSDVRRGRPEVYSRSMTGLRHCLEQRVLTGVCTSLCQSNIDDLLTETWVDRLIEMGVMYTWFHIYRPVGPDAAVELALTPDQQRRARQFVVDMRVKKPIIFIDAYYDADGRALCPMATGFTHHISPWGDIEPCPIIQFAHDSIHDSRPLRQVFNDSEFLRDMRAAAATHTRGCIVLERPDVIRQLVEKHGAHDSTARHTALTELADMQPRSSQYAPGTEIPEKSWAYWLAKKIAFHEYGVYTRHFRPENWQPPSPQPPLPEPSAPAGADAPASSLVQLRT
ncbi:MAG: radical SAM/SPASM domain-containing protein [Pirellulaceae bacterium]